MSVSPLQALQSANHPAHPLKTKPQALIAGATGVLGNAVLQRLVGALRFEHCTVLAREPMAQGMRTVSSTVVAGEITTWRSLAADIAIVMFEPARMFYERERALYTPLPEQLPELAQWLLSSGVKTLCVVLPHTQGSLPEALKAGLASLDDHAVASLSFERVILLRSAQKPSAQKKSHLLEGLAHWMLSIFKFMVPQTEQPVRATKIALLVDALLTHAARGCTVIAPEQVWRFAQLPDDEISGAVSAWLGDSSTRLLP